MVSASYYIPKDNKLGEDAHFICADEDTVGVADGVGGFAKQGIDAGEYARSLMINSADATTKAFSKSLKNDCETPFSREYESLGGQMHLGGKTDDIAVIYS